MFVCVKAWAYTRACAYTQARGARPQPLSHSAQWPESRLSSVLGVTSGGGAPGSGRAPRSGAQIGDSHGQSRVGDTDRHTRDRSTNPGAAPAPGPAAWAGPRAHGRAAARGRAHTTARTQPDTHARGAARHTTTPHSIDRLLASPFVLATLGQLGGTAVVRPPKGRRRRRRRRRHPLLLLLLLLLRRRAAQRPGISFAYDSGSLLSSVLCSHVPNAVSASSASVGP